jgi:peptidoglycan-N-acetylmuramic acid deacetylase
VVGHFLETAPDIVKRMADEGHSVGNHTYHHPDMSAISDITSFQKEMEDVEKLYFEITGKDIDKYYRPPQGKYSEDNLAMAKELGYKTFFWSLAYVDWDVNAQPTKSEAFDKLLSRIHPGAIVLLHSTSATNGQILDELLSEWEKMGYICSAIRDIKLAAHFCDVVNKLFGIFPAKAWIGDRFTVDMLADLLTAFLYIALYHNTFDEIFDIA